jgi:DNA-binding CsgD family transcriptional regulator
VKKTILLYGGAIALAAFVLEWAEYKYLTRAFATEIYVVLIAVAFTALGLWAGRRLTAKAPAGSFVRNAAAIASLGLTDRECEVLALLAEGITNKEIARRLDVSPNTVKTHASRLYEKLGAGRRTEAVRKARDLALIP